MPATAHWHSLWRTVTLGIILAIYLPRFLTEGLDNDGLTYASVARNMAVGAGSCWRPYLVRAESYWIPTEQTPDNVFYGHPPVLFFLESLLYRLLGDQWYVEKLFSALSFALLLAGCGRAWQVLFPAEPLRAFSWLPVLWVATAWQVRFAASNNLLNVPQAACCVWALAAMVRGLRTPAWTAWTWALVWSFAAFLCKGPFAFFLWAVPGLYWLVFERTAARLLPRAAQTAGLVLGFAALLGLLLVYTPAREFLGEYFRRQVLAVWSGNRVERFSGTEGPWGRFYIAGVMVLNVAPMLLSTLVMVRRTRPLEPEAQTGLWLCTVGLAATLPMLLIDKQFAHYVVTGTPCFALGFAAWQVRFWQESFERTSLTAHDLQAALGAAVLGFAGLTYLTFQLNFSGTPRLMQTRIAEIKAHSKLPYNQRVGILSVPDIQNDYYLNLYLQRYRRIELTPQTARTPYLLTYANPREFARAQALGYHRIDCLPANRVCFWKK